MTKNRRGLIILICCGIVLVLGILLFFTLAIIDNHKAKTYDGSITNPNSNFELKLVISKSWTNDEGTENQTEGQQFDFTIIDNKNYNLNDWEMTFDINVLGYSLKEVDSVWNVSYEIDGTKVTVTPEKDIDLVSISRSKNNSFGFILINNK